jgi:capsular polysaccharide transport system permease protein
MSSTEEITEPAPPPPAPSEDLVADEATGTELLPPADDKPKKRGIMLLVLRVLGKGPGRNKSLAVREPTLISTTEVGAPPPPKRPGFFRRHFLFLLTVFLPTALSIFYFGFYASDIYVSESSYVVRSPSQKSVGQTGLGAVLQGATGMSGFARAPDDVHAVADYIQSEDALEQLETNLKVGEWWSSPVVDVLQRFNPLARPFSMEKLFEYYPRRVQVLVNDKSGITKLTVSSFTAEQAASINTLLLGEAEHLVNVLNKRGREDLIKFAQGEVRLAEEKAKTAAGALSEFRNTQAVVDPEKQTMLHFEQIARLQEELIRTRGQLTQLKVFAPDSPHPPALELRAQTLEQEIAAETEKITGGEQSLASKAAEYQRLQLEREFSDKQLAIAMAALEGARNEAQRQQLYLETIDKPNQPDKAIYPKRIRGIITTFLLGLIAWGILAMLLAGVREHQY